MLEQRPEQDRLAWWTEGLLNDRRYSDYVAERLARAYVGVGDGPVVIYRRNRFVTWLSDQLHANRPYDALARELIASDGLWTNAPQTNFLTATAKPQTGNNPDPVVLAARVYRAFLGVRVDCAQCHDHPFDRWTQEDFHQLAAFFGKTETSFTGLREGRGEYKWERHGAEKEVVAEPSVPFSPELLPAGRNNRRRLAGWVTDPKNRAFARAIVNRVWALMFGRPLVEPIDNVPLGGQAPAPLETLAADFASHHYDLRRLIHLIAASEAFGATVSKSRG